MPILTVNQGRCYDLYREGYTQAAIADMLGISQPAVSKSLHRALRILGRHEPREVLMSNDDIDRLDLRRLAVL